MKVKIEIKYPVSREFIDVAYWLEKAMREKKDILLLESTNHNNLVISNSCGFYFPEEWVKR